MFGHLQLFLLISFLAVAAAVTEGGVYLRNDATNALTLAEDRNNANLARGYVNAVWKKYSDIIVPASSDPSKLQGNPLVVQFAQDTVEFFQKMPIMRVNVYSSKGLLLMTDNIPGAPLLYGNSASVDRNFVVTKLQADDNQHSQLVDEAPISGIEHAKLLQTVIPIHSTTNPAQIEGALEIMINISDAWAKLVDQQITGTAIVLGAFTFFLLVVSFSVRRTEVIIARQHEANLELTQQAATALAENQDKSQFLTNISHELRTPLNAIIGFSDIIKLELLPKLTERKYDQYVNDINSAGVHLLSLINDILDYSKAEAGKLNIEVSEIDVTKMVQNCMRLVGPRAESGEVKLIEEMPKDHIVMMTDGKKLKQVLLNLLSNAVKFTPSAGSVTVTAWISLVDDSISFMVTDTGIGIAPKDISRAMSPFGQVDNTLKRKYEGTGLGLPLTKKFVELMGGKFHIESEVGKGTKVTFSLPKEMAAREGVVIRKSE